MSERLERLKCRLGWHKPSLYGTWAPDPDLGYRGRFRWQSMCERPLCHEVIWGAWL